MNKLKCIYAILDFNPVKDKYISDVSRKLEFMLKGLDGSFVYSLTYKDISAVVSDINKDSLKVNAEYALAYEKIMELLMEKYTLLPMRFGTLVKNDKEVTGILRENYDVFVNNLKQVNGKLEYGLKVLWDIENNEIESDAKDLSKIDEPKEDSRYKKYLMGKLKEHKINEAVIKRAEQIIENINKPLADLSFLNKFKKMITPKLILDAVYLVENKKKNVFIEKVEELKNTHNNLNFLLTGPWPPYNFVTTENAEVKADAGK